MGIGQVRIRWRRLADHGEIPRSGNVSRAPRGAERTASGCVWNVAAMQNGQERSGMARGAGLNRAIKRLYGASTRK